MNHNESVVALKNLSAQFREEGTTVLLEVHCTSFLIPQHGVRGFPTIKIFGANKASPEDFQGDRTAAGIVQAAQRTAQKVVQDRLGGRSSG
jgi:hypothetical protein